MLSYPSVPPNHPEIPTLRIATDPKGITALRHLVDLLTELAHPSVIAVESTKFEKTRAEVALTAVTGSPLDSGLDIDALVKATASAAAAIAHTHDHNVALNNIDAASFVVRKDQSVVLCGFDAAARSATTKDKREDMRLFAEFATSCLPVVDLIRDRINNVAPTPLRESFVRILEQASKGELDARNLAEKLRHALWFDNTTATQHELKIKRTTHPSARRGIRPGRRSGIATAIVLIAVTIVAGTRLQSNAAPSPQKTSVPSCQLHIGTTTDVDNDGCPDAVTMKYGVVTINNERYAVGEPDDEMVIGNWNCNGKITLALLRPTTGELFVFDNWPKPGSSTKPRVLATGAPATGLHAVSTGNCDALGVGSHQFDAQKAK